MVDGIHAHSIAQPLVMKSIFNLSTPLLLALVGTLMFSGSREACHAQGGVIVTFANQMPERVIVRRVNHRGNVVVANPDTPVNPGASMPVHAIPGENFSILLGTRQIGVYTASGKPNQHFPIARGGGMAVNPPAAAVGLVTVTFTNTSSRVITVNRVNPGQAPQAFGALQPGKSMSMQAVAGQIWSFLNSNGKEFGSYRVTAAPSQAYSITGN